MTYTELEDLRDLTVQAFKLFNDLSKDPSYDSKNPRMTWVQKRSEAWAIYVEARDLLINKTATYKVTKENEHGTQRQIN